MEMVVTGQPVQHESRSSWVSQPAKHSHHGCFEFVHVVYSGIWADVEYPREPAPFQSILVVLDLMPVVASISLVLAVDVAIQIVAVPTTANQRPDFLG